MNIEIKKLGEIRETLDSVTRLRTINECLHSYSVTFSERRKLLVEANHIENKIADMISQIDAMVFTNNE